MFCTDTNVLSTMLHVILNARSRRTRSCLVSNCNTHEYHSKHGSFLLCTIHLLRRRINNLCTHQCELYLRGLKDGDVPRGASQGDNPPDPQLLPAFSPPSSYQQTAVPQVSTPYENFPMTACFCFSCFRIRVSNRAEASVARTAQPFGMSLALRSMSQNSPHRHYNHSDAQEYHPYHR